MRGLLKEELRMYKNSANAYELYRQNDVYTSSQGKLLLMLYDGAIKFLGRSRLYIDNKNYQEANRNIIKAENILTELMCTLNMDYQLSENLFGLYDYLKQRLIEANIKKDNKAVGEVLDMLIDLRNTWQSAIASL